jgi:hypothetical protein
MWRIEFSSEKFLPVLPEECQVNPGAYGFELALWLAQALLKQNIVTSYPLGEDWGWLIEYSDADENEYSIGCSSMSEHDEGYSGQPIQWSIFIRPYRSLTERLKGISRNAQIEQLGQQIVAALQAERIVVEPTTD